MLEMSRGSLICTTDDKVAVHSQAKGHTDKSIFWAWISDVFLPEVVRRRQAFGYEGKVVLIMNSYTGPEVDELWEVHGIIICPLPLHSSNQVQLLDLSTFGITKRSIAHINHMKTVSVQSSHIARVVSAFLSASSPLDIIRTFRSAGIMLCLVSDEKLFCRVSPEPARCLIAGFSPWEETTPSEDEIGQAKAGPVSNIVPTLSQKRSHPKQNKYFSRYCFRPSSKENLLRENIGGVVLRRGVFPRREIFP
jgi:hypothetical protein